MSSREFRLKTKAADTQSKPAVEEGKTIREDSEEKLKPPRQKAARKKRGAGGGGKN
jgi:hypothetical protein